MSFSNDVREEIARSITDRDRQFACLYGILLYSAFLPKNKWFCKAKVRCSHG